MFIEWTSYHSCYSFDFSSYQRSHIHLTMHILQAVLRMLRQISVLWTSAPTASGLENTTASMMLGELETPSWTGMEHRLARAAIKVSLPQGHPWPGLPTRLAMQDTKTSTRKSFRSIWFVPWLAVPLWNITIFNWLLLVMFIYSKDESPHCQTVWSMMISCTISFRFIVK